MKITKNEACTLYYALDFLRILQGLTGEDKELLNKLYKLINAKD